MKRHLMFYLFCLMLVISASQCKKRRIDPNRLPPATQEGKGVFACKVNGKSWTSGKRLEKLGAWVSNDSLSVFASLTLDNNKRIEDFFIRLEGAFSSNISQYQLNDSLKAYAMFLTVGDNSCLKDIGGYGNAGKSKSYAGNLTLTKVDTIQFIMSGVFAFNIPTDFCDTMRITEGRFDIKYK